MRTSGQMEFFVFISSSPIDPKRTKHSGWKVLESCFSRVLLIPQPWSLGPLKSICPWVGYFSPSTRLHTSRKIEAKFCKTLFGHLGEIISHEPKEKNGLLAYKSLMPRLCMCMGVNKIDWLNNAIENVKTIYVCNRMLISAHHIATGVGCRPPGLGNVPYGLSTIKEHGLLVTRIKRATNLLRGTAEFLLLYLVLCYDHGNLWNIHRRAINLTIPPLHQLEFEIVSFKTAFLYECTKIASNNLELLLLYTAESYNIV